MMRLLLLAAAGFELADPRALAGPGEVTAVSVMPGPGRVEVVIDVAGSVSVQDFTLRNPDRLVIDVLGATLKVPNIAYDGQNRGGVTNIRYAQFRPDVVRIVLDLERLIDYDLEYADDVIRVSLGSDRTFAPWSSADFRRMVERAVAAEAAADAAGAAVPPVKPAASGTNRAPQQQPVTSQQPPITVTWDNASISDVAAGFAAFSGKSIIVGAGVTATISATIKNQPWDLAFQQILQAQGLAGREDIPGIIRVDNPATLAALDSIEPVSTVIHRVNYAKAADLVTSLGAVKSARGQIVADPATNSLIITDVESRIPQYERFLNQLDIRTPQVSIQTKLVFVDRTDLEHLGVQYDLGAPTQFFNRLVQRVDPRTAEPVDTDGDGVPDAIQGTETFSEDEIVIDLGGNALAALANASGSVSGAALELIFSTAIGNFNLTSFLQALEEVRLSDLQAEPLISTADNTQATIQVGERTPIRIVDVSSVGGTGANVPRAQVTQENTGIILRVTPHVTADRHVLMDIHAENSSVVAAPGDAGIAFRTQQANTRMLVNDGETAVIGGLTVTEIDISKAGIPFLVDLPVIGRMFGFTRRSERRRDLLILVTPHIVDEPGAVPPEQR